MTGWKRSWCWERLKAEGEGDDRGWDGRIASPTRWTWVWASSGSWWWTGKPGMLQSMGPWRVGPDWATGLNWVITVPTGFWSVWAAEVWELLVKVIWGEIAGHWENICKFSMSYKYIWIQNWTQSLKKKYRLRNCLLMLEAEEYTVWIWVQITSSVQSLSRVWLFVTTWTAARQASLSLTNSWSLLKLMSIESVMPSNHLILCRPLLLLPSIFPRIRVFSSESALHIRRPKYWSFSFNISPSNEHSGLIFRMYWWDLLVVQRTLKSLLQHHSSKASILRHSAFFIVQLSHPYVTTGITIALTRWTFVGKVMSLLFNMLSWLVVAFLPKSKHLFISWLKSPSAVILEPKKIKSATVSIVSPSICHEVMGLDAMIFVFWILSFKPTFLLSSFTFIKRFFSSLLSPIRMVSSAYLRLLVFLQQSWFQLVLHPAQCFSWCTLHIS